MSNIAVCGQMKWLLSQFVAVCHRIDVNATVNVESEFLLMKCDEEMSAENALFLLCVFKKARQFGHAFCV